MHKPVSCLCSVCVGTRVEQVGVVFFCNMVVILFGVSSEWRNGPTGPLTLSDEDIASYNKDGWRRINTLAYYKVHDGAYMSLLHRQHTYKTLNGTCSTD